MHNISFSRSKHLGGNVYIKTINFVENIRDIKAWIIIWDIILVNK